MGAGAYQVGSKYYDTLENAIENATTGTTIKVINDVVDSSAPSIPVSKNITLNTNGKTIELKTSSLEVSGNLKLTGKGTIETYEAIPAIINSGVLEISDGVTVTGGTYGIVTSTNVTFTDGRIQGPTDVIKLNNYILSKILESEHYLRPKSFHISFRNSNIFLLIIFITNTLLF